MAIDFYFHAAQGGTDTRMPITVPQALVYFQDIFVSVYAPNIPTFVTHVSLYSYLH